MIQMYLLNESPLYGNNKPKLWIHTKYERNARFWKSFQSRSSTDLNQPYLHLTVQSLVEKNNQDFHICLIDDDSFEKLLPSWKQDKALRNFPEPERSHQRLVGLMQLMYYYGGVLVPDSFICCRPLLPLYESAVKASVPFVTERLNRSKNILHEMKEKQEFLADTYFMGCKKNDAVLLDYIEFLRDQNRSLHIHAEHDFLGHPSWWMENAVRERRATLLDGDVIGVKKRNGEAITLEDLLQEEPLDISGEVFGVYLPENELLTRTAYQWFTVMSGKDILHSRLAIAHIFRHALSPQEHIPACSIALI